MGRFLAVAMPSGFVFPGSVPPLAFPSSTPAEPRRIDVTPTDLTRGVSRRSRGSTKPRAHSGIVTTPDTRTRRIVAGNGKAAAARPTASRATRGKAASDTTGDARPKTGRDVIRYARNSGVEIVDLKFVDVPGIWQHFSFTLDELTEGLFTDGIGFDGSSIRGFQKIHESDMLLFPDPASAFVDPVLRVPTLSII